MAKWRERHFRYLLLTFHTHYWINNKVGGIRAEQDEKALQDSLHDTGPTTVGIA